ncbi:phage head-binding domain-containing protein [Kluyvera genomosp. 1]|uniref:phage head-binding domain-containing protein n=1 Tax=Kluyvera genomosp. 1 TaxID=2774053 RepID=UPI00068DE7E9|nr:phage head-binding domain-containing protein [Kluyvera genomosp. 1]
MSDITANVVVSNPRPIFTDSRTFRAVANGRVYIGLIDTDPVNPANQIPVYIENEDGSHVQIAQPLTINSAGKIVYSGQLVKIVTVTGHSMAIYDAYGTQVDYIANVLKYDPDQLRTELAEEGSELLVDDSRVKVLQAEHGVARSQHSKNNDFISLLDYGVPSDGDYGKTLQLAIDDLFAEGGGTVFIPRGVYSASGVKLKTGVSINGDSKEGISWIPLNNNIVMFDDSDKPDETHGMICSISNISIDCKAFTGITGVRSINGNRINILNTNFFGCEKNIEFDRGGNHVISNVLSATTTDGNKAGRLLLWSSDDDKYGAVFTTVDNYRVEGDSVDGAVFLRRAVGVKFNNLIVNDNSFDGICIVLENDCQGVLFNGGVIVGVGTGMLLRKGSGIDKSPIVCITQNLDFDQFEQSAIVIEAGRANQFFGGAITSSDISVTAKAIVLNGEFAINNTLNNLLISGYYGLTGTGVLISDATNNTLNNVIVDGCDQGIAFVGNCKGTVINGGDVRSNVNHPIVGDIHQEGISVKDLQGFRGSTVVSTPPIPVSGVEVTNIYGVPVRIFINGGAVSLIAINGVSSGFTTGAMLFLEPGEKITVTYSTTPSWNWIGV